MAAGLTSRLPRASRGATPAAPRRRIPDPPERLLLASTGAPFGRTIIAKTRGLAAPSAKITVLSIAKIWGTALGLPHPGLQPTKAEWEQQREIVDGAAEALRRHGFEVRVRVVKTRRPAKMIARWAQELRMHAVVMPETATGSRARRIVEGDLPRDIYRRSGVPVFAISQDGSVQRAGADQGR